MRAEWVPDNVSEKDLKEEANYRASKLGYCTKHGNQTSRIKISVGWSRKYADNYERIKNGS